MMLMPPAPAPGSGKPVNGFASVGTDAAEIQRTGLKAFTKSIGILGTCIKEAPEFANRRRKVTHVAPPATTH